MEKDIESQELEILKQNSLQCGEREREREKHDQKWSSWDLPSISMGC